jgi:cytoskeletal protein CcmA (bactofilin family)
MFKNRQSGDISTAMTGQIGANIRITGKIDADHAIGFGGEMDGDISAEDVTVTDTAMITGKITAKSATIAGTVTGDIIADKLIILSSAVVKGSLHYTTIQIETGAQVEGQFNQKSQTAVSGEPDISDDE